MNEKGDNDLEKIIEDLKARVKELESINDSHQKLNGQLRKELEDVRKALARVS
jgi:TolA-binding protein